MVSSLAEGGYVVAMKGHIRKKTNYGRKYTLKVYKSHNEEISFNYMCTKT
jgi:hypothetical protein